MAKSTCAALLASKQAFWSPPKGTQGPEYGDGSRSLSKGAFCRGGCAACGSFSGLTGRCLLLRCQHHCVVAAYPSNPANPALVFGGSDESGSFKQFWKVFIFISVVPPRFEIETSASKTCVICWSVNSPSPGLQNFSFFLGSCTIRRDAMDHTGVVLKTAFYNDVAKNIQPDS